MRFFLLVSLALSLAACAPKPYSHLAAIAEVKYSLKAKDYVFSFDKVLYTCQVKGKTPLGKKFNLSGLLFLKEMEDGATRVVFQNQMGITYFDFGWNAQNHFTVYSIIDQMNKPALIKTLQKDFELLLYKNLKSDAAVFMDNETKQYLKFELEKGFAYYIFDKGNLVGIENADEKRKVVVMQLANTIGGKSLGSNINIKHLRANFEIDLEQLKPEDNDITEE